MTLGTCNFGSCSRETPHEKDPECINWQPIPVTEREEKLEQALRELVEQFHAYQNGWMGVGVWRTRIGLPAALEQAVKLLDKREG